jgi:hypothetical protein
MLSSHPDAERAFGPLFAKRLNVKSLSHQVEHLGLTGSISYLLPLILPEPILPQDVIQGCQLAIAERQNVVHNREGVRDVRPKILRTSLTAIRRMCHLLESLTAQAPQGNAADEQAT